MKEQDILEALASRQVKRLIENSGSREKLRRRLGDYFDICAYQERVVGALALSKSMGPVMFEAGRKVGRVLSAKSLSVIRKLPNYQSFSKSETLEEARRSTEWLTLQMMCRVTGTGYLNMVAYEKDKRLVFQVEECVDCTGIPNLGESVCYYLGGQLAGAIEVAIGKNVGFVETLCQAKGDSCCEFKFAILSEERSGKWVMQDTVD